MENQDREKIIELKRKADKKRDCIMPKGIGEKNDTVNTVHRAFIEDEMVRANAQREARVYLDRNEKQVGVSRLVWFVNGMIFVIILEVIALNTTIMDTIAKFFAG
jgi:hypothetical protein